MEITATMVKELREQTGAGLMDCKKALAETSGDIEAAVDWLRKKGMKSAAKKAGRETAEGRVYSVISPDGRSGALIALACETDFVAKTDDFNKFVEALAKHVLENKPTSVDACLAQPWAAGGTVEDALKGVIGSLGENMQLAGVAYLEAGDGYVGAYIHHDNKKGVLTAIRTGADLAKTTDMARDIGMHVTALNPAGLNREDVPEDVVERERAIYMESVQNKPEDMREKIVEGMLGRFFKEQVLEEQGFAKDMDKKVSKVVEDTLGKGSAITAFRRFAVGG
ncbi:MAG: elongation factor Ts [Planctomycetes bacterium]|nr:elongation factor Ts [Planctomycetota bacterium]